MHRSIFLMFANQAELEGIKTLGLDSVFTGFQNIGALNAIRSSVGKDIKVNIELQAFSKDSYLKHITDSDVVSSDPAIDVSNGLCPSSETVRNELLKNTQYSIDLGVDGIWIDSLRYPTKWERETPIIADTCYCPRCIKKFEGYLGDKLKYKDLEELALLVDGSYYIEWIEFKTGMLTSMVQEVKDLIVKSGKKITLGYFAVPWDDSEYGSAIKRAVGQDFTALSGIVDITSPMLYHKMCGKSVEWIKDRVDYFWNLGTPVLPGVQTEDKPTPLSPQELSQAVANASGGSSMGAYVFFADNLFKDEAKTDILKSGFFKLTE